MNSDLFASADSLQLLPIQDAEVYYLPAVELGRPLDVLLHTLIQEIPWRSETVSVWGKHYLQPRLIAWYGDREQRYTYSGITLDPNPWTALLLEIRTKVEATARASFNSVLLNYYRDHRDSMGLHSDDEPELGKKPTIASLSLGETRTLLMKHRRRQDIRPVRIHLTSGSLLLMKGETQACWKHGIEKEKRPCGPRVNLTFRRILSSSADRL